MTGWKTRIHSFHPPPFLFLRHQGLTTKPGSPLSLQASQPSLWNEFPLPISSFSSSRIKKTLSNRLLFFIQGDRHTRRSHHRPRQDGTRAHFRSGHSRHHQCDALRRPWHCHDYRKRSVGKDVGTIIKKKSAEAELWVTKCAGRANSGDDDGAAGFLQRANWRLLFMTYLVGKYLLVESAMMPPT